MIENKTVEEIKNRWKKINDSTHSDDYKNFAKIAIPMLFDEIHYYEGVLNEFCKGNSEIYKLDRRIDILDAMKRFDNQFS